MSKWPRFTIAATLMAVVCGVSSSPLDAALISHQEVTTVAGNALVGSRVLSALGQQVAGGSDSATDTSSRVVQFPGFNTELGRLESVVWSVDFFGRTSTDIFAGCEKLFGPPFLGCRVDAETTVDFRSVARVVEMSSPGVFNFETLLRGGSLATVDITSRSDLITCAVLGGDSGPCADFSGDTTAASNRVDRSAAREAYFRDMVPVTIDSELFAELNARCTGISIAAVCGASSETSGDATFRIDLEYAYTPTPRPVAVPTGSTLLMFATGMVGIMGLLSFRVPRA